MDCCGLVWPRFRNGTTFRKNNVLLGNLAAQFLETFCFPSRTRLHGITIKDGRYFPGGSSLQRSGPVLYQGQRFASGAFGLYVDQKALAAGATSYRFGPAPDATLPKSGWTRPTSRKAAFAFTSTAVSRPSGEI